MPATDLDLQKIHTGIRAMQSSAEQLLAGSEHFPALNRNVRRIQASLMMLEMDICDLLDSESRPEE